MIKSKGPAYKGFRCLWVKGLKCGYDGAKPSLEACLTCVSTNLQQKLLIAAHFNEEIRKNVSNGNSNSEQFVNMIACEQAEKLASISEFLNALNSVARALLHRFEVPSSHQSYVS